MSNVLKIILGLSLVIFQHALQAKTEVVQSRLTIESISSNLYQHISFNSYNGAIVPSNGLIYILDDQAIIIDTPWSDSATHKLLDWIEKQGLTVKLSISTHSHSDTAAGIPILNQLNIPTYVLDKTNQLLAAENKTQASHSFAPPMLELIKNKVELHYVGGGHTIDNIVVWLPEEKLLFGGCIVKSARSKHLGYIKEADMAAWPHSLKKLQTQFSSAEIVMPGHGKYGGIDLIEHSIYLLNQQASKH